LKEVLKKDFESENRLKSETIGSYLQTDVCESF
jgi:hypothetical protein